MLIAQYLLTQTHFDFLVFNYHIQHQCSIYIAVYTSLLICPNISLRKIISCGILDRTYQNILSISDALLKLSGKTAQIKQLFAPY